MERIANEERFRSICADGLGVVFNDFVRHGASGAQYNVVHPASCRWLARSSLSVPKLWFEDLATATDWLVRERGTEGERGNAARRVSVAPRRRARSAEQSASPVPINSSSARRRLSGRRGRRGLSGGRLVDDAAAIRADRHDAADAR